MSVLNQQYIDNQLGNFAYFFREGMDFNEQQLKEIKLIAQEIIGIAEEREEGVTC